MASWNRQRYGEPAYTCPTIDEAIAKMEEVRKANDELREWGRDQYDRAESAEEELTDARKEISRLEARIEELEDELNSARDEIRQAAA